MISSLISYVTASLIASHSPTIRTSSQLYSVHPNIPKIPQSPLTFLEIRNSFPGAILCFTDGSKIGDRTGFAYSISDRIFASRHCNFYPNGQTSCHFSVPGENSLYPFSAVSHIPNCLRLLIRPVGHFKCSFYPPPSHT